LPEIVNDTKPGSVEASVGVLVVPRHELNKMIEDRKNICLKELNFINTKFY